MKLEEDISSGSMARLKRIMDLRNCSQKEALEFALTCGWLGAERLAEEKRLYTMGKASNQDPGNKAPLTKSNTNNDNKATATGKPVDPKRPKAN